MSHSTTNPWARRASAGHRTGRARRVVAAWSVLTAAVVVAGIGLGPDPAGAAPVTVDAPDPITVPGPDPGDEDHAGAADPYPAEATVSGAVGHVTDVTVTLHDLSHSFPLDLDVLLVGPDGHTVELLSDAGGLDPVGPVTVTFDDAAAGPVPAGPDGTITSGSYRPTDDDDTDGAQDVFPEPAPPAPWGHALSVFDGSDPNGTWQLFVVDDNTGDSGVIAGGWSVTVTTGVDAQPGAIRFASATATAHESDPTALVGLSRVGGADGVVSARVTATTGTAGVGDVVPSSEVVTFGDGQTTATVSVVLLDDDEVEGVDETVLLTLSDPTGGATLAPPSDAVLTVHDDDASSNDTPIAVPGTGTGSPAGGQAEPYPSTIVVADRIGPVTGVRVTLHDVTHSSPADLDVILVGPGPDGPAVVLMSDVGGTDPVAGTTWTFDDAATASMARDATAPPGTYRPSDDDTDGADAWPDLPDVQVGASLAAFVGLPSADGPWRLYVSDDAPGDVGTIAGWSIEVTTLLPEPPVDPGPGDPPGEDPGTAPPPPADPGPTGGTGTTGIRVLPATGHPAGALAVVGLTLVMAGIAAAGASRRG